MEAVKQREIMIVNNFMLQPHEREIIETVKRENHRLVIDRALPELQYIRLCSL